LDKNTHIHLNHFAYLVSAEVAFCGFGKCA
jgi:hypothetical protein